MANRIQGIKVEIGGDTIKLTTALKGVNSEIRNTQSQLKNVEKLLKLDPHNAELLALEQVAAGYIKGLASSAWNWGVDIVNGIANGIRNAIGNVVDAVKSIADKIAAFLHFSVPDEGLLTEYEPWMPDSYEVELNDVEADSGGETEAGTVQRDVVRLGVVHISVSFSASSKWLKLLTGFRQKEKISVEYFDTEMLEMKKTEMFLEGFKAGLVKDTSYKGLWKVSFTLLEF